jgi:undecaprenyl-diphosphatase
VSPSDAAVLGLVQGITEFLPVSSSGHLVLASRVLGVTGPGAQIATSLHLGTLAAVVVFTRRELVQLVRGFRSERASRRLGAAVVLGTTPAVVVGALLLPVSDALFSSSRWVAVGLACTAALLWHSRRTAPGSKVVPGYADALVVGLAQAAALIPGLSRSGATIWAAMERHVERAQAARFSFLLSIPATAGAAAAEIVRGPTVGATSALSLVLGGLVAALAGWLALGVLYRLVVGGRLWIFAPYCLAVALVTGLLSRA